MAKTVIVHILNQDPILAEMEELPDPASSFIAFSNPRKLDGKPINFIKAGAKSVMFPWHQVFFVEVMVSQDEQREVISHFREF